MIRSFTKLYSDFWINYDNSEVIRSGAEAQLMALYLQGNSHHNILGVYCLPLLYIASDLRLPVKKVQSALKKLCSINYCQYDKRTQYVWVCNLALEQLGTDIDIKDNRIKAIHAIWKDLPSQLEFLEEIYQKYKSAFHLEPRFSDTCRATPSLAACISTNIEKPMVCRVEEDIEEIKGIKDIKNIIDSEIKTELAVTDASLNISTDTNNINTGVVTSTSQTTDTVVHSNTDNIGECEGKGKGKAEDEAETESFNHNIESLKSLPISPFEGSSRPLSRVLETETMELVVEEELLNPPSEVSALSLKGIMKDAFDTAVSSQVIRFGSNLSDSFSSKGRDMVFLSHSKGFHSPCKAPSKGLRSPFEAPSEALRSNIDYRIENIENRNKNKEKGIEDRRKEKIKKRDINLSRVPIPNIAAQTRTFSELKAQDFYFSAGRLIFSKNTTACSTAAPEVQPAFGLEQKLELATQSRPQMESGLELEIQPKPQSQAQSQSELRLVTLPAPLPPQLALEPQPRLAEESKPDPESQPKPTAEHKPCSESQPKPVAEHKSCLESQSQPIPLQSQTGLVPESQLELASASASELPLESTLALQPEPSLYLHLHPEPVLGLGLGLGAESEAKSVLKPKLKAKQSVIIKPKKTNSKNDTDCSIAAVFSHWKTTMCYPRSNLDRKRKTLISEALKWGYTVQELCEAVTGCSRTPHNTGKNEQGQHYDGLHVILGDADQIDRFIRNCHNPPKPFTEAHRRLDANAHEAKSWVRAKLNESAGVRDRY